MSWLEEWVALQMIKVVVLHNILIHVVNIIVVILSIVNSLRIICLIELMTTLIC